MKPFRFILTAFIAVSASATFALPRDAVQKQAFRRTNPCPVTGERRGACPGYEVDHKRALMNGGADKPKNMQWLSRQQHEAKTRHDHVACRKSYFCKNDRLKKKLPWQKAEVGAAYVAYLARPAASGEIRTQWPKGFHPPDAGRHGRVFREGAAWRG